MKVKTITGLGLMTALVVVLQIISNYITPGAVSINLAIIPIVIGAIMFGPLGGLFLGLVDGALILSAPSTAFFLSYNAWATVLLCLLKTGIAGLVAGFIPKLIKNEKISTLVASVVVPILNTGLFIVGCLVFFMPLLSESLGIVNLGGIIVGLIGINFIIEFVVIVLLAPTTYYIYRIEATKKPSID